MWTAQYFHFANPRRWIQSGGLGTMGFGLPAAMGAKVGCPDELVVCVAGDGSIQMNIQELATCATEGIDVKVFVVNNGYLGHGPPVAGAVLGQAVQRRRHARRRCLSEWPDFVKLAEAMGATGMRFADKNTPRRRHPRRRWRRRGR